MGVTPSATPFRPVILGGDLATYTLARAFHAEQAVVSTVVTRAVPGPVRDSKIIDNVTCPEMDDQSALLACLRDIADAHPGETILLLGAIDLWVERLAELAGRLDSRFVVPYPAPELIKQMADKQSFAAACEEAGVPHPVTRFVPAETSSDGVPDLVVGMQLPLVVKAADSVAFGELSLAGKEKVSYCPDIASLQSLHRTITEAGYPAALVVQERIPGGDEQMRVLTTYSDRSGRVRWGRMAKVLLEDHDPAMIGNPLALMHGSSDTAYAYAVKLLEEVGWTGYANFDIKVDPRTGTEYFFELNPRLGRSHAYLSAAGHPLTVPYVREYVERRDPLDGVQMGAENDDWLYSIVPLPLLTRYVTDPETRASIAHIRRLGGVLRPLRYQRDPGPARQLAQVRSDTKYIRNFATHYRGPVQT